MPEVVEHDLIVTRGRGGRVMAVCGWCEDMATAHSCTVDVLHLDGTRVEMIPFGAARGGHAGGRR
jgi:hypothetical protein